MSLRRRLIVLPALAVASAVALASAVTYVSVDRALRSSLDARLRTLAADVATAPGRRVPPIAPAQRLDQPLGRSFLLVLPASPLGERAGYAQVVSPSGAVQRPLRARGVDLAAGARVRAVARGAADPYFYDARLSGTPVRVYVSRFGPRLALQSAVSLAEVRASTRRLAWVLAIVGLAGVGLAAVVGRILGDAAMRPVRRLARDVRYVAATQDLSLRVPALGGDELGFLGRSFNAMLEALAESRRAQRRLVADASHELRTPLTTVSAGVELLARDVVLPPADRRRLRADLASQFQELTSLVGDLVELAREHAPAVELECFDLAALVRDAVEGARPRFPGLTFALELAPSPVRADRARLRRAVVNLLDNAGKWSPPGATVLVRLAGGELVVADEGPGIGAGDRGRVFDRFYRAPEARALPGSGLGLAIVRQVAEMHGGTAWAAPGPARGAELHLRIPELRRTALPG
jgi:two-component system sensor histidine kinase MprB